MIKNIGNVIVKDVNNEIECSIQSENISGVGFEYDVEPNSFYIFYIEGTVITQNSNTIVGITLNSNDNDNHNEFPMKKYHSNIDIQSSICCKDFAILHNGNRNNTFIKFYTHTNTKMTINVLIKNGYPGDKFTITSRYLKKLKTIIWNAKEDYANVGTRMSTFINRFMLDYYSIIICFFPHPFDYEILHDFDTTDKDNFRKFKLFIDPIIKTVDIVIWMDEFSSTSTESYIKKKFLIDKTAYILFHGVLARNNPQRNIEENLETFNKFIISVDMYEIFNNLQPRIPFVTAPYSIPSNINEILNNRHKNDKIIIKHSPTSYNNKGTRLIEKVIAQIVAKYNNVIYEPIGKPYPNHLPNTELIKSKINCDIYIDQCCENIGGCGVSTWESLCYGCIVMCTINKVSNEAWSKIFNDEPPIIPLKENEIDLFTKLDNLCKKSKNDLKEIQQKNVEWISNHYSNNSYKIFMNNLLE